MNHTEYMNKTRKMSDDSLRYVIKDCQEALKANPDSEKAGHYADEICYCSMEIVKRKI